MHIKQIRQLSQHIKGISIDIIAMQCLICHNVTPTKTNRHRRANRLFFLCTRHIRFRVLYRHIRLPFEGILPVYQLNFICFCIIGYIEKMNVILNMICYLLCHITQAKIGIPINIIALHSFRMPIKGYLLLQRNCRFCYPFLCRIGCCSEHCHCQKHRKKSFHTLRSLLFFRKYYPFLLFDIFILPYFLFGNITVL